MQMTLHTLHTDPYLHKSLSPANLLTMFVQVFLFQVALLQGFVVSSCPESPMHPLLCPLKNNLCPLKNFT